MNCPACNGRTRVAETRVAEEGAALRRRRVCLECGRRFTTFERVEASRLWVVKRDGSRQRFDPAKLGAALRGAAHKREVNGEDLDAIVGRVEAVAEEAGGEISSERVSELCLIALRELDQGAYLQFLGTLPGKSPEFPEVSS